MTNSGSDSGGDGGAGVSGKLPSEMPDPVEYDEAEVRARVIETTDECDPGPSTERAARKGDVFTTVVDKYGYPPPVVEEAWNRLREEHRIVTVYPNQYRVKR